MKTERYVPPYDYYYKAIDVIMMTILEHVSS